MRGARILIVEDEAIVAMDLARRLESMGYAIADSVSTGERAVEVVRQAAPDLAVVDVRLRGSLSGAQAVLRMRALANFPVVFLTAYSDDETLDEIKRCEPRGYLLKPFDERALWVTIETALHTHEAERRRAAAEAAMRRSDALCAAILDHSHDAIICGDQAGRITIFNQGAQATFGYAPDRVLGQPLAAVLPADITAKLATMVETLARGGTPTRPPGEALNTTARRMNGEEFPIGVAISCIEVEGGPVSAAFISDLSEHQALERKVARATQLDAVARRAGGAAHDFNNLLTGVLGYARLLKSSFSAGDPRLHDIEEIEQAGARAAGLVSELLAYGRPQDAPERSDLANVLGRLERLLSHLVAPRCEVEIHVEGDLPSIAIGALKMEQVVLNLVLNARDAMPEGGRVRVQARLADGAGQGPEGEVPFVLLSVADDGVGMDEATRSQLFEPFFTTRAESGGTGLGLASVHEIVTHGGGRIRVESAPGAGSRFEVLLPAASGVLPERAQTAAHLTPNTVLLVDDEPLVREVAARVLRESGYEVLVAADGREGLEVVEAYAGALDLMVTDVMMPEMNGYQLAARAAAIRPQLRIALMSGFGAAPLGDPRLSAVRAALPLIEKPFDADFLVRRVAELLAEPPPTNDADRRALS